MRIRGFSHPYVHWISFGKDGISWYTYGDMKSQNLMKSVALSSLLILILGGCFFVSPASGEDIEDMTEEERQKELEKLDEKAEKYQEILDLKEKQVGIISGQISSIAVKIAGLESQIREKESKISDISRELEVTLRGISEKERLIDRQKVALSEMIREYHSGMDDGAAVFLSADSGISQLFLKREDWMMETGQRVRTLLHEMERTKSVLVSERSELEAERTEVESLKTELREKNGELETLKTEKQTQLSRTRTEQQNYEDKLARVEAQKNELLNFSATANIAEVYESVEKYDRPDEKYWASTSWYYSQHDSRWGDVKMGKSGSLMKDWGCAVSSVAMVFTELGSRIDPGALAKKPIFYYDLIEWPTTWSGGIERVSSTAHGNVSWSTIDREIADGNPVIVYIRRSRGGGHYVVIHTKTKKGDYVVHDPYFGANLYLDTSRSLVGKLGTDSPTRIDQMIIYND